VGDGRGGDVIAEVPGRAGRWDGAAANVLVIASMVESLQILLSKSARVSSLGQTLCLNIMEEERESAVGLWMMIQAS